MARVALPAFIARPVEWVNWSLENFLAGAFATLSSAIVMSAIVHTAIIFGVGIRAANPELFQSAQPLEVVLVNARSQTRPLDADVLAQANLDGGGDVDEDRQAKSPLLASERNAQAATDTLDSRIKTLEEQTKQLMTQAKSDYGINQERSDAPAPTRPTAPAPYSLAEASIEMARLQARISTDWDAYQKRPRRAFVGARAQEYVFARYIDDWRLKVERVGNLNYPEAAKRDRLHGSLVVTVSIRSDGTLEDSQINRSSGSRVLDAAALRILEMSQPFAPFSDEMRKSVDILTFSRTWQFTTSDRLQGE